MHPMPELTPLLKQLRLSGILDTLEARHREALDQRLSYVDFLARLVADEVARREQKKFHLRLRRAGFRSTKTIEQFDFAASPGLHAALVHELASCRFVDGTSTMHSPMAPLCRSSVAPYPGRPPHGGAD